MAACQTIILLVLLVVMTMRWQRFLSSLKMVVPYIVIIAICIMSTLWSDHPLSTLRRGVTLGICVMFGVYCYDAFGLRRLIHILSFVAMSLAVLSLLAYFVMPQIGREQAIEYNDAMRGVFAQKNGMAEYMLLGIVCRSYIFIENMRLVPFCLSVALLYSCIVLAHSVTSLLIATIVLITTVWLVVRDKPRVRLAFGFAASSTFLLLISGIVLMPDQMFEALGRDETLTGRLPLWNLVISAIAERPLLGHGYSGFWDANSIDVQYLWQRAGWMAPDSHNGYLDIMLQIGVLGIALYGWLWVRVLRLGWKAWQSGTLPIAAWIILFMMVNLMVNLDEGPLPWADEFTAAGPAVLITLERWNKSHWRSGLQGGQRGLTQQQPVQQVTSVRTKSAAAQSGHGIYGNG
jgi:O-antigen ligase